MTTKQLELKSNEIRQSIIAMLVEAGSGHSAGPLGLTEVMTCLYFELLNINPNKPNDPKRDRLILSAGHLAPLLYATLAHRGFFSLDYLTKLRQLGSPLQGHPERGRLPGIEVNAGPLGQGVSVAVGIALAAKTDLPEVRVHIVSSDGEHNEGQVYEALLLAAKYKLHNLTLWLDRNSIQIDGFTEDVLPLESLAEKYRAFGWYVLEIDGHNPEEIIAAGRHAKAVFDSPTAIICHTVPGKGVDFMERDYRWHGKVPKNSEAIKALRELRTLRGKIMSEAD